MTRPFITELHYVGFVEEVGRRSFWLHLFEQAGSLEKTGGFLAEECSVQVLKRKLPRAERKRLFVGIEADVRFGYYDRRCGRTRGWKIRFGPLQPPTKQELRAQREAAEALYRQLEDQLRCIDDL